MNPVVSRVVMNLVVNQVMMNTVVSQVVMWNLKMMIKLPNRQVTKVTIFNMAINYQASMAKLLKLFIDIKESKSNHKSYVLLMQSL